MRNKFSAFILYSLGFLNQTNQDTLHDYILSIMSAASAISTRFHNFPEKYSQSNN